MILEAMKGENKSNTRYGRAQKALGKNSCGLRFARPFVHNQTTLLIFLVVAMCVWLTISLKTFLSNLPT